MNKKGIIIAIIAIIVIVVIGICVFMTQNKETKQVVAENDVQEQSNNETQNTYEFKDGDKAISLNSNFAELNMPKENNYYEVPFKYVGKKICVNFFSKRNQDFVIGCI